MLDEKKVFNMEDFKRMILDQHSDYAALLTPFILKLNSKKQDLSTVEVKALETLNGWDYDMSAGLAAPSIFEFFRISFAKKLLSDELGDLYEQLFSTAREYYIYRILKTGPDEWVDNITTSQKETLDDIVLASFKDCISALTLQYGPDQSKWNWGNIHKITIAHPLASVKILDKVFGLNSETVGIGGSNHTVSPYTYGAGFKVNHGASERHIFNTANWDESLTVIPTGASGIPASEFYLSQTKSYLEGKFYKDAFSEKAVKAAAIYTLNLKPGE
jgi:penicillin G amidase